MAPKPGDTTIEEIALEEGQVTGNGTAKYYNPEVVRHHKDGLHRYADVKDEFKGKDHYLQADDGKLEVLRVQIAPGKQPLNNTKNTWERPVEENPFKTMWRGFRNSPSSIIRWTFNESLKRKRGISSQQPDDTYIKYPVACLLLTLTALFGNIEADILWGGRYPPVRYSYYCYPKVARNERERKPDRSSPSIHTLSHSSQINTQPQHRSSPIRRIQPRHDEYDNVFGRHLRPRWLCVIDNNPKGYKVVEVDKWDETRSARVSGEYVFVSYTRLHFKTPAEGLPELAAIGIASAKDVGLQAFWIDNLCLPKELPGQETQDSHRICDIARGAYRMVIAVRDKTPKQNETLDTLLEGWASRLWTLPELLLAPTGQDIAIYQVIPNNPSSMSRPVCMIAKRNMAERAYMKDGELVRQLVDHFEASLQLTQTELFTLGLECLLKRTYNAFFPADPIYALMTLARRRPWPKQEETLFEAFAQLSLLNDSNQLLERLLCTLPKERGSPWYKIEDFWNVKLWDIVPNVQVAAITSDDSVLIDGAFGASIEWRMLNNVGILKRRTVWRTITGFLIRFAPGWLITACILLAFMGKPIPSENVVYDSSGYPKYVESKKVNPGVAAAIIFFLIAFAAIASLPFFVLGRYCGKFWSTQAQLFGLEGHADLDYLETSLFGLSDGRLKWAAAGSTQSSHEQKYDGEHIEGEYQALEPVDSELPVLDPLPEESKPLDPDRLFTLVDTYSMTAMVFRAVHPPSVALVCGQEGGMRRALLCSYDYKTQTFHRETVVRMPTKVLDRMDRVDKFRFSMKSMPL